MKVLLINPTKWQTMFIEMPPFMHHADSTQRLPPLGLTYIAAFLISHTDHEVAILDANLEDLTYDEIQERIRKYKPDVIGVSAYTFNFLDTVEIVHRAKMINPDVFVVIGGPHAFIYPAQTAMLPYVDAVVPGEGEEVMTELVEAIAKGTPIEKVAGLYFNKQGKLIATPERSIIKDLDILPFPARQLIPQEAYKFVTDTRPFSTTMISSRGCRFKCTFCDVPFHSIRARSPNNVALEIDKCAKMGYKEINFYDDNFNFSEGRVENICKEIINRDINIYFSIRARVDKVNPQMLKSLYRAGCRRISFGIEAGNDQTLKYLKKGITTDMVRRAIKFTKDAGIKVSGYFILAIPNEPKELSLRTIDFAIELAPDYAQFMYMFLSPGTEIYNEALKSGAIDHDFYLDFAKQPKHVTYKAYWEKPISFEEAITLTKLAYKRFYLRPMYILKRLREIRSLTELVRNSIAAINIASFSFR